MKMASACLTLALVAASAWSGCAASTEAQKQTLKTQAAFDLNCDTLAISETGPNTFGVEGCGKRASYLCEDAYEPPTCIMSKLLSEPTGAQPTVTPGDSPEGADPTMNSTP